MGATDGSSGTNRGLYEKYKVYRTDASDRAPGGKHYGCQYFVLDLTHDEAAREALTAYWEAIREVPEKEALAGDISELIFKLDNARQTFVNSNEPVTGWPIPKFPKPGDGYIYVGPPDAPKPEGFREGIDTHMIVPEADYDQIEGEAIDDALRADPSQPHEYIGFEGMQIDRCQVCTLSKGNALHGKVI